MGEKKPTTETTTSAAAIRDFGGIIDRVSRGDVRVRIEDDGIPVAAIISVAELERLQEHERRRAERFKIVDEMRAAFAGVPAEEIEREAAKAIAEVRAERRAERQSKQERVAVT